MLVMFTKFLSQNLNTCLVTVLKYMKRKTKKIIYWFRRKQTNVVTKCNDQS